MRILHVTPYYKPSYVYGGPIHSCSALCEALVKMGNQVTVLTTNANGTEKLNVTLGKVYDVDGVEVIYFDRLRQDNTFLSPTLTAYLWKNIKQYDVVHIHTWWNLVSVFAAIICSLKGKEIVLSPRGMLADYIITTNNPVLKKLIHIFIAKSVLTTAKFHVTADSEYEEVSKLFPKAKIYTVYNFIKLPEIVERSKDKQVVRTEMLFLSRVHPKKGIDLFLKALKHITWNYHFTIAGPFNDEYKQELVDLSKALGIEDNIRWLGPVYGDEKFGLLASKDLMVLTSHNENFGNVVIESLAMGCPVFISDMVGLSPYIIQKNLGWISTTNPDDIAEKLNQYHAELDKQNWVRDHAPLIIRDDFSEKSLIEKYLNIYRS